MWYKFPIQFQDPGNIDLKYFSKISLSLKETREGHFGLISLYHMYRKELDQTLFFETYGEAEIEFTKITEILNAK